MRFDFDDPANRLLLVTGLGLVLVCGATALLSIRGSLLNAEIGLPSGAILAAVALCLAGAAACAWVARRITQTALPDAPDRALSNGTPTPSPRSDAPWTQRRAWRTPTLRDQAPRLDSKLLFGGLMFGVVCGVIIAEGLVNLFAYGISMPGNTWMPVVMIFVSIGLSLRGVWPLAKACRFGRTTLTLDTHPARLGRRFTAVFHTSMRAAQVPDDGFDVSLSCYRRTVEWVYDDDGDRRRQVQRKLLWRDGKRVRPRLRGQQVDIPVSFGVPPDQPPSPARLAEERIVWEASAHADVPGVDYGASFEVPVFAPEDGDAPAPEDDAPDAADAPDPAEPAWTLDGDRAGAWAGDAAADDAPDEPYEAYILKHDFTEPVTERIQMERPGGGGVRFHFGAGGFLAMSAITGGMALLLAPLTYFAFTGGALLLGLFLSLFVLATGFMFLKLQFESTTVTVANGRVVVETHLLGRTTRLAFDAAALTDARLDVGGTAMSSTSYTLRLIPADPAEIASLEGQQRAMRMRKRFLERLGTDEETLTDKARHEQAQLDAQANSVTAATNLWNREEAEWIAAEILAAAERESAFEPRSFDDDLPRPEAAS